MKILAIIGGLFLVEQNLKCFRSPHYAAPVVGLMLILVVQGLRHMRAWQSDGKPSGVSLCRAVILICILMVPVQSVFLRTLANSRWLRSGPPRAQTMDRLSSREGTHLLFVHYSSDHEHPSSIGSTTRLISTIQRLCGRAIWGPRGTKNWCGISRSSGLACTARYHAPHAGSLSVGRLGDLLFPKDFSCSLNREKDKKNSATGIFS